MNESVSDVIAARARQPQGLGWMVGTSICTNSNLAAVSFAPSTKLGSKYRYSSKPWWKLKNGAML